MASASMHGRSIDGRCGRIRQRDAPSHFRLQSFLGHHLTKMTNIARIGILERKCDFTRVKPHHSHSSRAPNEEG
eukprot:scaffold1803_cov150-Skeletonema_marinoi.AAC.3